MARQDKATVSISEASRLTGKGRQTLYRHIKNGKLSATKDGDGSRVIQVVELERVYGISVSMEQQPPVPDHTAVQQVDTSALESEITRLTTDNERLSEQVKDLKRDKDWLQGLVDDLTIKRLPSPIQTAWSKFFK